MTIRSSLFWAAWKDGLSLRAFAVELFQHPHMMLFYFTSFAKHFSNVMLSTAGQLIWTYMFFRICASIILISSQIMRHLYRVKRASNDLKRLALIEPPDLVASLRAPEFVWFDRAIAGSGDRPPTGAMFLIRCLASRDLREDAIEHAADKFELDQAKKGRGWAVYNCWYDATVSFHPLVARIIERWINGR